MYNTNSDIRFKTPMPKSSDYSDACMLVKARIKITGVRADDAGRQAD